MARILLVDDDAGTLAGFAGILGQAGFDVIATSEGSEALRIAFAQPVDLILADLCMPGLGALDLLREASQRRIRLPLVVVTGFGAIDTAVESLKLGALDYVLKPLIGDDLLRAVECGLGRRSESVCLALPPAVAAEHAARWARAVAAVIALPIDPKTVGGWARGIAVAAGTIRSWCRVAGAPPKKSLDLARALRAVHLGTLRRRPMHEFLDIADRRTLTRLIAGAAARPEVASMTLSEVLAQQRFIEDEELLRNVQQALVDLGILVSERAAADRSSEKKFR